MKIVIYGTGKIAKVFLDRLRDHGDVEILSFVETLPTKETFQEKPVVDPTGIPWIEADALIICSDVYHEEIMETLKKLPTFEINKGKVVKYDHFFSSEIARIRKMMPFQSCLVENGSISYIARSEDEAIPLEMFRSGRNWAWKEMEAFIELSKVYYKKEAKGTFLDIGANIGTTSIYMKKRLPEVDVIGFELTKENHAIFRMNCIANETEDIVVENLALSEKNGLCDYHYVGFNSGGSGIQSAGSGSSVQMKTLDSYLQERGIEPNKLFGIWMDVEGHECSVIKGAKSSLNNASFPLLMEFSPNAYDENALDDVVGILSRNYTGFIDIREYITKNKFIRPIRSLLYYKDELIGSGRLQTDLYFMSAD